MPYNCNDKTPHHPDPVDVTMDRPRGKNFMKTFSALGRKGTIVYGI